MSFLTGSVDNLPDRGSDPDRSARGGLSETLAKVAGGDPRYTSWVGGEKERLISQDLDKARESLSPSPAPGLFARAALAQTTELALKEYQRLSAVDLNLVYLSDKDRVVPPDVFVDHVAVHRGQAVVNDG